MPPHPEGGCGGGYRVAVTVDHLGDPTAGPFGQHRPRSDSLQLLGPRVDLTVRFRAAPAPLTDTQHRRTARHRQIPDQGPGSAMTHRPGPTPRASHELGVALGEQPQFAVDDLLSADHQPGQAHQSSGAAATFNNGQGSLLLQTINPQNDGALARVVGLPNQPRELTTPHTPTR